MSIIGIARKAASTDYEIVQNGVQNFPGSWRYSQRSAKVASF
jgi:hypothetical protein